MAGRETKSLPSTMAVNPRIHIQCCVASGLHSLEHSRRQDRQKARSVEIRQGNRHPEAAILRHLGGHCKNIGGKYRVSAPADRLNEIDARSTQAGLVRYFPL